jgi:hypothetical protein
MQRGVNADAAPLLTTWLTNDNAYSWLETAGRYGLEDVAQVMSICTVRIMTHN